MLHVINALNLIDMESETHYSLRDEIPLGEYPQTHDFYEFTLVTDGRFKMQVGAVSYMAETGDLFLIRPGVVHGKYAIAAQRSSHINLAFFASTMEDLFMYLFSDTPENVLPKDQSLFRIQQNMKDYLQTEMEYLALFPASEKKGKNIYLRHLLANIIYSIIIPTTEKQVATPVWFRKTLEELKRQDTLSEGLPAIVSRTGLSEAHICRTFKRYLGMTPTQYINTMRLNYIANMLVHSDRPIKDLAEKSGFSSFSYFYSQFKKKFSTPPAEYRKSHFGQRSKFQKLG